MTRWRVAAFWVMLTGCACAGGSKVNMKSAVHLWTHRTAVVPGSGSLPAASFTGDVMLLGSEAIDIRTGQVLWSASDATVLGARGDRAVLLRRNGDAYVGVDQVDVKTGAIATSAPIHEQGGALRSLRVGGSLLLAADRACHLQFSKVSCLDVASGAVVWTASVPSADGAAWAATSEVLAVFTNTGPGASGAPPEPQIVALDLTTGVERFRAAVDCCSLTTSPTGTLLVQRGSNTVELDARGAEGRRWPGRVVDIAGDLMLMVRGRDLFAVTTSGAEHARIPDAGAMPAALCGDGVAYYHAADRTVRRRELADGSDVKIVELADRSGITERRGPVTARATLSIAPRCRLPLVFIQDWYVSAYRL